MLPNHFIILWDNQPIGFDSNSGGYPFKTKHPGEVKYWAKREEAEKYMRIINYEGMIVKEIQFRIMETGHSSLSVAVK